MPLRVMHFILSILKIMQLYACRYQQNYQHATVYSLVIVQLGQGEAEGGRGYKLQLLLHQAKNMSAFVSIITIASRPMQNEDLTNFSDGTYVVHMKNSLFFFSSFEPTIIIILTKFYCQFQL